MRVRVCCLGLVGALAVACATDTPSDTSDAETPTLPAYKQPHEELSGSASALTEACSSPAETCPDWYGTWEVGVFDALTVEEWAYLAVVSETAEVDARRVDPVLRKAMRAVPIAAALAGDARMLVPPEPARDADACDQLEDTSERLSCLVDAFKQSIVELLFAHPTLQAGQAIAQKLDAKADRVAAIAQELGKTPDELERAVLVHLRGLGLGFVQAIRTSSVEVATELELNGDVQHVVDGLPTISGFLAVLDDADSGTLADPALAVRLGLGGPATPDCDGLPEGARRCNGTSVEQCSSGLIVRADCGGAGCAIDPLFGATCVDTCGLVSFHGECRDDTAVWCDGGGGLNAVDCSDAGGCTVDGKARCVDGCDAIPQPGECQGNLLRRCIAGRPDEWDCGDEGCFVVNGNPRCGDPCEGVPEAGTCGGDVLSWCDRTVASGTVLLQSCADYGGCVHDTNGASCRSEEPDFCTGQADECLADVLISCVEPARGHQSLDCEPFGGCVTTSDGARCNEVPSLGPWKVGRAGSAPGIDLTITAGTEGLFAMQFGYRHYAACQMTSGLAFLCDVGSYDVPGALTDDFVCLAFMSGSEIERLNLWADVVIMGSAVEVYWDSPVTLRATGTFIDNETLQFEQTVSFLPPPTECEDLSNPNQWTVEEARLWFGEGRWEATR